MQRISEIDALAFGRPYLVDRERERLHQERFQRQREEGYQLLAELCRLGEYDQAKQLANQHSSWGYEIVDGVVVEKID